MQKQFRLKIIVMLVANLKLYGCGYTKIGDFTMHRYRLRPKNWIDIVTGRPKEAGMKFRSVRVTTNSGKPLVRHVFSRFEVDM